MTSQEFIDLVDTVRGLNESLSEVLFEHIGETSLFFDLHTTGNQTIITFMDTTIWSSDDDEREYDEANDEYEPMQGYLEKRAGELLEMVKKIKF